MTSATPRRSTRIQEKSHSSPSAPQDGFPSSSPTTTSPKMSSTPSKQPTERAPYLPTTLETALLILYPATLILGSLFALLDPTTRNAPYSAAMQSHDPAFAPSYFAKKGNLFNTVFVKRGWFWITASYLLFLFTHPSTAARARRVQGLARWAVVTVWWVFVTQWFFGPAIIDRGFMYTGGACEIVAEEEAGTLPLREATRLLSGMACKAVGGKWAGGHDISGHVFLLVLGSMFLFEEVLHVVLRKPPVQEERTVVMEDGSVKSAAAESKDGDSGAEQRWDLGVKAALGVGVLSIWMLLMTAIYFHTWFEKVTGLMMAFFGVFVVYFVPRLLPAWRAVIGIPGV